MHLNRKEATAALLKVLASNIPIAGGAISEAIGAVVSSKDEYDTANRLKNLMNAIALITPEDLRESVFEYLGTETHDRLVQKLDLLYFNNGTPPHIAYLVFLNAWEAGAFKEIEKMSDQDKLMTLLYLVGMAHSIIEKGYVSDKSETLDSEQSSRLANLLTVHLATINQEGMRIDQMASMLSHLGDIYSTAHKYVEAASCQIKALEFAVLGGLRSIKTVRRGSATWFSNIEGVLAGLGGNLNSAKMFDLAADALIRADNFANRMGNSNYYLPVFNLAVVYVNMGKTDEAVAAYERFLSRTDLQAHSTYGRSDFLWTLREKAAVHIMEHKQPKPDINMKCLCGSGLPYKDCCQPESMNCQ